MSRFVSARIRSERARFVGASGMYASPPVSGSFHTRVVPLGAICATWDSMPPLA